MYTYFTILYDIFVDEMIKAMKPKEPKCYGYGCHNDGYGHGHHPHAMQRVLQLQKARQ